MEFNNQQGVWIGVEDLSGDETFIEIAKQEFVSFPEAISEGKEMDGFTPNRRDFLKYMGFGLGAATIAAGCEIPLKRAIPYVTKPDAIVPGVANYYASSFVKGGDYCSILVKTREGRPIKIEGNSLSGVTKGGTSARAQASVLSLYDVNRIQNPGGIKDGKVDGKGNWSDLDKIIAGKLNAGSNVRIVAHTIMSPTAKKALAAFTAKYPNTKVAMYDPMSSAAILLANEQNFGDKVIPAYHFDKANVIVSFGADFLGTWISPVEYAGDYIKNRKIDNPEEAKMSRFVQVESHMSMTGSNADNRILVRPSEQGAAIAALYNAVAAGSNGSGVSAPAVNDRAAKALKKVAQELLANRGKSLIVSNSNNVGEQMLVNATNQLLGNYGATVDFVGASLQRQGDETGVQSIIKEMNNGGVDAVIIWGANPVFELPNGDQFKAGMAKARLSVSFNEVMDETTAACQYAAPMNHFLESWSDAEPKRGYYSLIQPTISPLFSTRQAEHSILQWAGAAPQTEQPMYDYVKSVWQTDMFPKQTAFSSFQAFWDSTLHDGVYEAPQSGATPAFRGDLSAAAAQINKPGTGLEISFFETVNMGSGQYANNPWLQETPDPVTRTVWNNTLALPLKYNGGRDYESVNNLKDGEQAEITVNGKKYTVTINRQFGQMENTTAIALGYGRTAAGYCGTGVGTDVQSAQGIGAGGLTQYFASGIQLSGKTGTDKKFASVQYHHTMGVHAAGKKDYNVDEAMIGFQGGLVERSVIRQTNLKEVKKFVEELKDERAEFQKLNSYTLYPGHMDKYTSGHHWGMYIDLNSCIGCGACTVACMSENNVPVVGKTEVHRHHEMTWLRIDRYFYGDVENPNTVYQPMLCQHCDNAPCENVCPVNATNHSSEGLNQMAYNRCIGTRYCANNCPYKVRRFNWQDYTTADIFPWNERDLRGETIGYNTEMPYGADNLTRMVLNPDVTVRSRGVMEKCSFCVQRIQEGKLTAKRESRQLREGDIKTACQTACPTEAIVFGDKNNPASKLRQKTDSPMNFIVLEEVNVKSNITYSTKVINKDETLEA